MNNKEVKVKNMCVKGVSKHVLLETDCYKYYKQDENRYECMHQGLSINGSASNCLCKEAINDPCIGCA